MMTSCRIGTTISESAGVLSWTHLAVAGKTSGVLSQCPPPTDDRYRDLPSLCYGCVPSTDPMTCAESLKESDGMDTDGRVEKGTQRRAGKI